MTEQPQYEDGQIINGWKYVAATNSWERAMEPPVNPDGPGTGWAQVEPVKKPGLSAGKIIGLVLGGVIGLLVLIGGCGAIVAGVTSEAPKAQPAPAAPVQPAPNYNPPAPEPDYGDLADIALESAWDQQSSSDQRALCEAWDLGDTAQDVILDQFSEAVAETTITRSDIRSFFDRKC